MSIDVYGIGNPLIDIITSVSEEDLKTLGKNKGSMHLIDENERAVILDLIKDNEINYQCGGSCPNTLISLSHFGCNTVVSGKVGFDEYGSVYISSLENSGAVSNLVQDNGPTGSSIILLTPDSERTMNTYLGVNRMYKAENVNEKLLSEALYFYFTGYMWDTDDQKEAILKAINISKKKNVKIVFDVADPFAVERYKDDFIRLIEDHVSILFANEEEAKMLYGSDDFEKNLKRFETNTEIVSIKLGAKGSVTGFGGKEYYQRITPVSAVDTTGAGDMYAAGFLYGLINGCSPESAAEYASVVAAEIVQVRGAQFSEEGYENVYAKLRKAAGL
jgi:sugar/nucleoside kinase (ribokinase family)